jgi:hypothetical protein
MRWLRRHHIIFIYSVTHAYPNVKLLGELESRTVISKVKIFSEVCRLFNDAFSVTQTVQWNCDKRIVNWKGFGMKWSLYNFKVLSRISPGGTDVNTKNLIQDSRSAGQNLNLGPPEYKAGVLATRPRRSVVSVEAAPICLRWSLTGRQILIFQMDRLVT